MAGCSILDLVTGGGLLPHVYCKKVTLENGTPSESTIMPFNEGNIRVTLNLEILQSKNDLSKSTWLNNLTLGNQNILDFMYIQIVPFQKGVNVDKLRPHVHTSYEHNQNYPGNPYIVSGHPKTKEILKNNNLLSLFPIGSSHPALAMFGYSAAMASEGYSNLFQREDNAIWGYNLNKIPAPIQVSNSSLLGNIAGADLLSTEGKQTYVREEIINGKPYYAIPFEYTYDYQITTVGAPWGRALGFLFYSFLNIPLFLQSNIQSDASSFLNQNVLTGPVNTEVIFWDGKPKVTRPQFLLPDGEAWNGGVHLHMCGLNPDPSGYCGDGKLGSKKGWMAGEIHQPGAPRLSLVMVPNYKIQDFRFTPKDPVETVNGLPNVHTGPGTWERAVPFNPYDPSTFTQSGVEAILGPFQKETRKYLTKFDNAPGVGGGGVSLYDNDSEYSRLYITRDKDNSARGLFLIDFDKLLRNNSSLYPLLDGTEQDLIIQNCLLKSNLIELKIYRDRVKKVPVGSRYENYANDTSYEEPSYLVGTISDGSFYGISKNSENLKEIDLVFSDFSNTQGMKKVRCFTFTDIDVGTKSAGLYQYRVEVLFRDGTYHFLNQILKDLSRARVEMQDYYDLSLGSYDRAGAQHMNTANSNNLKSQARKSLVPYYQHGSFVDQFLIDALNRFPGIEPWTDGTNNHPTVTRILNLISSVFNLSATVPVTDNNVNMSWIIDPSAGSPKGIDFVVRLADSMIDHLHGLVGSTKVNKTGSELAMSSLPNGYTFNNFFDYIVSSSEAMIREDHSFDDPTELHRALSNEDIYMDYLSVGPSPSAPGLDPGPIKLGSAYYKNRCRLDALRLSPAVKDDAAFKGESPSATLYRPRPGGPAPDSFNHTAYSYLMPSIIELSDPSEEDTSFKFLFNAFNNNADPSDTGAINNTFDFFDYDKILIALTNYHYNKIEVDDADLLPDYYKSEKELPREAYKNLFNSIGMTVHSKAGYNRFFKNGFDKESGAISEKAAPTTDEFVPVFPKDFSDRDLSTEFYYKKFFFDEANVFNTPTGDMRIEKLAAMVSYGDFPNIFKLPVTKEHEAGLNLIQDPADPAFNAENIVLELGTLFGEAVQNTSYGTKLEPKYNSFFFLNASLVSKIQVYTGASIDTSPLKNDNDSWRTLVENDLNTPTGDLFCRVVLYDEKAAQGMKLPIINKYFLINLSDWTPSPPSAHQIYPPSLVPRQEFMEKQNVMKVQKASKAVGQNLVSSPTGDSKIKKELTQSQAKQLSPTAKKAGDSAGSLKEDLKSTTGQGQSGGNYSGNGGVF